jgi:hypothetical protein
VLVLGINLEFIKTDGVYRLGVDLVSE